jgi:ribulose-phosphate 3-epimerase
MIEIEASILSADFMRLGEQAREAEMAGVDGIQVDIMDGRFVPNITFGPDIVRALRNEVKVKIDAHLMIVEPERYVKEFSKAGAHRLFVHQEACTHLDRVIDTIRELGMEAGVAINPGTSPDVLEEVLDIVDIIQIMTVNPGFGGQEFIASQVDKIRRLREILDKRGYNTNSAVGGERRSYCTGGRIEYIQQGRLGS